VDSYWEQMMAYVPDHAAYQALAVMDIVPDESLDRG
jgi:hypothetical protein